MGRAKTTPTLSASFHPITNVIKQNTIPILSPTTPTRTPLPNVLHQFLVTNHLRDPPLVLAIFIGRGDLLRFLLDDPHDGGLGFDNFAPGE